MIREIIVGQCEISCHAPLAAPGIANDEAALLLVITHCENSVAASDLFVLERQRSAARARHFS